LDEELLFRAAILRKLHLRQVHLNFSFPPQNFPGLFDAQRDFQFPRKNIDRPQRQNSQAHFGEPLGVANAVEHFIHRAVTAGRRNGIEPIANRFRRKTARITRPGGGFERRAPADFIQVLAEMPRFIPARSRIEDDASWHAQMILMECVIVEDKERLSDKIHF
jgi:hypothetical protein